MKKITLVPLLFGMMQIVFAQKGPVPKSYLGISFGTSYSIGDFEDTDITNPHAGLAKDGRKIDVFDGFFLSERATLTGGFRYQSFESDLDDIITIFNNQNPGAEFEGSSNKMKFIFTCYTVFLSLTIHAQESLTGIWHIGRDDTKIEITNKNGVHEGRIVASANANAKIGTLILKDVRSVNGNWKGEIYIHKIKKWLDADLKLAEDKLLVTVKSGWMSKTVEWKKVAARFENGGIQ